jgi:pimeloyl-ACP methyl ester carboxylesterase
MTSEVIAAPPRAPDDAVKAAKEASVEAHKTQTTASGNRIPGPASAAPRWPFFTAEDGTPLYFTDFGRRGDPTAVFVSSWALDADMWQYQTVPLVARGVRCVAYDRRGHGRSGRPAEGYDFDTLADDLAALLEQLDLHDVTLVSHSMGAREVARMLRRHGDGRVARIALLAPNTPFLRQTPENPDGVPVAALDAVRAAIANDFPGWLAANARGFVVPETSDAMLDWVGGLMLRCSLHAALALNAAFVADDASDDLRRVSVPALVVHGDKDLSAPLHLTGEKTAALLPHARLLRYEGAPHGIFLTHTERLNADLLAFIQGQGRA